MHNLSAVDIIDGEKDSPTAKREMIRRHMPAAKEEDRQWKNAEDPTTEKLRLWADSGGFRFDVC